MDVNPFQVLRKLYAFVKRHINRLFEQKLWITIHMVQIRALMVASSKLVLNLSLLCSILFLFRSIIILSKECFKFGIILLLFLLIIAVKIIILSYLIWHCFLLSLLHFRGLFRFPASWPLSSFKRPFVILLDMGLTSFKISPQLLINFFLSFITFAGFFLDLESLLKVNIIYIFRRCRCLDRSRGLLFWLVDLLSLKLIIRLFCHGILT